jgi:predicted homoserine dehydrogenase-like protein
MRHGRVSDTFAYAKKDNAKGTLVQHAIGGDEVYGLIDEAKKADAANHVPQGVLDIEGIKERPVFKRAVKKDEPITWDDIDIPANRMVELWEQQKPHIGLK